MRKESEVLLAAQNGNLAKLECLFEQRQSKVFAGFFKGPNINWRNDNGCTALHLAALNGHREAVIFLLHNDASANTPDNAGSFPLHLAAFNGHAEVARILLERGPSKARVNEPNMTGDTPLHVAAQYNHHTAMDVLLKHHADIYLRNAKEETALDLAAQYGRFYAVQLLLFKDLGILKDAVHKHSPLHLAARNGHVKVVRLLLDSGMPINATCDMGTALHVSALYGKVEVAKLLLKRGIDIEIENDSNEKVLDLLCKAPSQISQLITALIYEMSDDSLSETSQRSRTESMPTTNLSCYDYVPSFRNVNTDAIERPGVTSSESPVAGAIYPYVKVEGIGSGARRLSNVSDGLDLASVTGNKENDKLYASTGDLALYTLVDVGFNNMQENDDPNKQIDSSPKGGIKQSRTDSSKLNLDDEYVEFGSFTPRGQHVISSKAAEPGVSQQLKPIILPSKVHLFNDNDSSNRESIYHVPPKLSEERSSHSAIPDFPPPSPTISNSIIANVIRRTTISKNTNDDNEDINNNQQAMLTAAANNLLGIKSLSRSVPINIGMHNEFDNNRGYISKGNEQYPDSYDNFLLKNTPANVNLDNYDNVNLCPSLKQSSPDESIQSYDNVNLSHGEACISYDNVHLKNIPSSEYYETNLKKKEKSIKQKRTTNFIKCDIPLDDGQQSSNVKDINQSSLLPKQTPSMVIPKLYETEDEGSISIEEAAPGNEEKPVPKPRTKVKQLRTSVQNVSQGYRMSNICNKTELDENYEWNKIDKFVSELELFAEASPAEESSSSQVATDSVSSWLNSCGLLQYEPIFLTNGYDDMMFLNGVLNDQDLIELGILHSEHRSKILESVLCLPKSPVIGDIDFPFPNTISEWLAKLKLSDYERRFIHYGYDNMERIRVIWELELVTVLDITTVGHCKRMICSLGKPPVKEKQPVLWNQKSDANVITRRSKVVDDSMDVAKQLWETAESLKIERQIRQNVTSNTEENQMTNKENILDNQSSTIQSCRDQWIHTSEVLTTGLVSYTIQYLGSHPVQEVKGVKSTLEACTKMKNISRNIHKMPSITLSISVRGIDYVDSNSKMIISQYPINNISYCAQDPVDFNIFAYITRDEFTRKHYCHVFKATSISLADEIIITIGQCFELAYQLHLNMMDNTKRLSLNQITQLKGPNVPARTRSLYGNEKIIDSKTQNIEQSNSGTRVPPRPPKPYTGRISEW